MTVGVKAGPGGRGGGGGGGGGGRGGRGSRGGRKKGGKPCQCKKGTSEKNREKVNKKKEGKPARCAKCGLTAGQSNANKIREKGYTGAKAALWRKFPIEADHKFPSSKIKADAKFKKLETKNLDSARSVMHLQSNIRGLCKDCNSRLQNRSGFQGADVHQKISSLL